VQRAVDVGEKFDQIIRLPGLGGDGGREQPALFRFLSPRWGR
jgi:hypothetical protein